MKGRDFLADMAARSRERVAAAIPRESEAALQARALAMPAPPPLRLASFDVIAELKMRSPAAGELQAASFDKRQQIEAYARGGACAVSVLTEPEEFNGTLADLEEAAALLQPFGIPAMRKDFLTAPYQLLEARAAGAGGALVIVTMLDDATVAELLSCALELDLFVLLEGFDTDDLSRIAALAEGADPQRVLAGVNCRNLSNLQVDFRRFAELSAALPGAMRTVAESGVGSAEDIRSVAGDGYSLALVGSALMSSDSPAQNLAAYIEAGRSATARRNTANGRSTA